VGVLVIRVLVFTAFCIVVLCFVMCGSFGNRCTCIYCVEYCCIVFCNVWEFW